MLSFWILIPLVFAGGYLLGRWQNRRWRYDRVAAAQRLLQLKVLSLEIKSLRQKVVSAQGRRTPPAQRRLVRKRPTLAWWKPPIAGLAAPALALADALHALFADDLYTLVASERSQGARRQNS